MSVEHFQDVIAIYELRGAYPSVPFTSGVDYDELIKGDDDPFFVTLPIGQVNSTSGNKRFYDEAFVQELEKQVVALRPVGGMGHLSDKDRATAFPPEAVHWVGTVREQEMLWGKGYVPPGPVRDRVRRYKATGRPLATSIDALASGQWDKAKGAMHMEAGSLQLRQIDIAPADRAGIASLAAVPHITQEMDGDTADSMEDNMDKLQVIQELTVADAKLLPDAVTEAILSTVETPEAVAQLAEVRETLSVEKDSDVLAKVTELLKAEQTRSQEQITETIAKLVDEKIVLESARPIIVDLVTNRSPESVEKVQETFDTVVALDSIVELLKVQAGASGPKVNGKTVAGKTDEPQYFKIPKGDDE